MYAAAHGKQSQKLHAVVMQAGSLVRACGNGHLREKWHDAKMADGPRDFWSGCHGSDAPPNEAPDGLSHDGLTAWPNTQEVTGWRQRKTKSGGGNWVVALCEFVFYVFYLSLP